jgi:hypothetical protein
MGQRNEAKVGGDTRNITLAGSMSEMGIFHQQSVNLARFARIIKKGWTMRRNNIEPLFQFLGPSFPQPGTECQPGGFQTAPLPIVLTPEEI